MLGGTPVVQEYEFDETILSTSDINVLIFDRVCADWAKFIYKNRSRTNPPFTHDYDIVIGPIADDGVAYLLGRYEEDSFTIEELAEKLRFKHLNNQYFFGTSKAISLLKGVFYKFHAFLNLHLDRLLFVAFCFYPAPFPFFLSRIARYAPSERK